MKKNKQLGQGLGALLTPSKNNLEDFNQSSILLSKIKPNPNQPRKNFADKSLKQLAQSIDEKGLISPITVKKVDNKYIIVAGERRYRAHKLLNKKRILVPMPLPLAEISARILQIMPQPMLTKDQLRLLKYDNVLSGKYKSNSEIGITSVRYFDDEVKKYCFMWRAGGQFSTERYSFNKDLEKENT